MVCADVVDFALLFMANVHDFGTAVGKPTPFSILGSGRDQAWNGVQQCIGFLKFGNGTKKPLRVGVGPIIKNLLPASVLRHAASIHDAQIIGYLVDDSHVVGDQQDGHAGLFLQITHQTQVLSLNGDIQSRGGFIGDELFGLTGQGHSDHDPLFHTP